MIGETRNQQRALITASQRTKFDQYFATYTLPYERVTFHPSINPMVSMMECLWVLSGRQGADGFATYGPLLRGLEVGSRIDLKETERHAMFTTRVKDGKLHAELIVRSAQDIYQLVSDSTCFSCVQERMATQHQLKMGGFLHICEDVSKVEFGQVSQCPYSSSRVHATPMWSPTLEQHVGMFLDEGVALGVRDRFLGRVAGPIRTALHTYFSNDEDKYAKAIKEASRAGQDNDWAIASMTFLDHARKAKS